ncbi:MAG TPA: fibronectin type III domain-containing protein [Pyrinomonadaceae bacterium]|nr:fibronectin type III domain-containing protein [Pyrinomonadaceae bacterium]
MADNFYKLSNAEFIIWMQNMLTFVENNIAPTGIDPAVITDAKTVRVSLANNLGERQALEDSLAGKNQEIKFNRASQNKAAAKIQAALKNNENILNSFIEEAGFNVDDGAKSPIAPIAPINLVVTGTSDGTNSLKWGRNANKYGVLFIIEAKFGDASQWTMIDVVKTAKYDHINQTPGAKVQYRIRTKSGDAVSTASNVAVIYG